MKDDGPLEQKMAVEIIYTSHSTDEGTKAKREPVSCPPSHSQLEAEQAVDSLFSARSDLIDLKGFPQKEQYRWTRRKMLYKQPLWVGRCLWREVMACTGRRGAKQDLESSKLFCSSEK